MKNINGKKIAIVGGGPGGLTLARLLQIKGADVSVYERDINRDARVQGATLDLHHDAGLKALRVAGLMNEFRAHYRPGADRLRIMDKDAKLIAEDGINEDEERSRPEIDRGPLRKILLDSLEPGTVVWDSQLVSLSPFNDSWKLQFKNGHTAVADLVVAADGAHSKIRPHVTDIQAFYSGVTIVEGAVYDSINTAPELHALLNGGKIFAMGDDKTLILSSKGDGSLNFYTGCKTEENWWRQSGIDFSNKTDVLDWFRKEFKGWNSVWDGLFEQAQTPFIPRPQYCMPLDQSWDALPNLTLLGDAAHLMPPYAGEGVNMAMLDALELSECLTGSGFQSLHEAIAAYEKAMRERASESARQTLESTEILHSPMAIPYLTQIIN